MKKSIQRVKFRIPHIRYHIQDGRLYVKIFHHESGDEELIVKVKQIQHIWMKEYDIIKIGETYKVWTRFDSKPDSTGTTFLVMRVPQIGDLFLKSLQGHIQSLFRYTLPIGLLLEMEKISNNIPSFKNISESFLRAHSIDADVIGNFFKKYPNQKSTHIKAEIKGELTQDSRIFKMKSVGVQKDLRGSMFLKNFTGQHLYLYRTTVQNSDIVEFLNKWVASENYQKLKTLQIDVTTDLRILPEQILGNFEIEEFDHADPSRRPSNFHYNPELIQVARRNECIRNTRFKEIRRKSDGKRAFLRCWGYRFLFFVEDETHNL